MSSSSHIPETPWGSWSCMDSRGSPPAGMRHHSVPSAHREDSADDEVLWECPGPGSLGLSAWVSLRVFPSGQGKWQHSVLQDTALRPWISGHVDAAMEMLVVGGRVLWPLTSSQLQGRQDPSSIVFCPLNSPTLWCMLNSWLGCRSLIYVPFKTIVHTPL